MRFDELREWTSLPAEGLEAIFRDERVLAVLPVSEPGSGRASVLVAMPHKVGVATLESVAGQRRWVTRWAPWDAVRLRVRATRRRIRRPRLWAAVDVGGRLFNAVLPQERGRVALRDFARAVRRRHRRLRGAQLVPA